MRENSFKNFIRTTFGSGSPIPFIISGNVALFILIYLFDILFELKIISIPLFQWTVDQLSLPTNFQAFIQQPWSLVTYNFLYTGLFNVAFDCLWLYWLGNIFFNFLNKRQFLFIYIFSGLLAGVIFLIFSHLALFSDIPNPYLNTGSITIAAILASIATLVPKYELRLLLFGNVKLKTIAIVYFAIQFLFFILTNKPAAISYFCAVIFGMGYTYALQSGMDWSNIFKKKDKRRSKLKVVVGHGERPMQQHRYDLPNQDQIDEILDKISLSGYDSLSSHEKEILFKASNNNKIDG
ncbi:rhomboid family intramembrane serine protease [Sphingobacterium faecium NBRC 15299]|uniref:rhomboid family intramembrane serine protease n=1 Tax=Sphingobacterium faecium TaxID=34087 RepID=UPI000D33FD63|nr:rhomboid family intramembrane serine protease [Sphingobacterium faecium]PTX12804.1 membrane associated rhomboid family serine protease [Sphingobacterium faecium]GEM62507.1 rhomboid family intramembrane serine protease [Sphingobacterium faecium NBRC 15299]